MTENREVTSSQDYLEHVREAYLKHRRLFEFIHSLCEMLLRAIIYDLVLMVPALIMLLLVYLNVFKGYLLRLMVLSFTSMVLAMLGLLFFFYLSVANIFREVMFIKPIVDLPDMRTEDLELLGEKLKGQHVKLRGKAKGIVTFKPIASEEDVFSEEVFTTSLFNIKVLKGNTYVFNRTVSFPIFLAVEDENGERLNVVLPPNVDDYKDFKVTFRPLKRRVLGRDVSISLLLSPMVEISSDRRGRRIFSQGEIRKMTSEDYVPEEPLGEVYLFREILQRDDYLREARKAFKELIEGEEIVNVEVSQEYIAPENEVLVLGILKPLKDLPISDALKEQVKSNLKVSDETLVISAEPGKPFLISEGDMDDFLRKYTVKKGFSKEFVIFIGSAIVVLVALIGWLVTILTIDPSGSLWPSVPITALLLIPYAVILGDKAQRIRDELMLDKLLERQVAKVLE